MSRTSKVLERLYRRLLERYGPQGWWPIVSLAGRAGFDERGYHGGDFTFPKTRAQRWEVVLGAVLTQNTSWKNAELALRALQGEGLLEGRRILGLDSAVLAALIRPSRYYVQKARKIGTVLSYLERCGRPTREGLLGVWGVGPETADSILLYAYGQPVFVVDAYTRRILQRLRIIDERAGYAEVQALFHEALPAEAPLFNEYHALIVEHGKRYYSMRPHGAGDRLLGGGLGGAGG